MKSLWFDLRVASALVCGLVLTACLQSQSHQCTDGTVCPIGLRCTAPGSTLPCVVPACGNGHLDPGEACDDGNNISGDGCPANCGPHCGDGHLDPGEACDDGNTVGGDGCSADCRTIETCTGNDATTCTSGGGPGGGGGPSHCVGSWSPIYVEPGVGPAAMAYDAAHGKVVVFRAGTSAVFGETWQWNGASWLLQSPTSAPPLRSEPAMVYDAARQHVVMFGGAGTSDNGVWEWDGANWIEQQPDTSPPLVSGHAMAYDAGRQRVVLFGGTTADGTAQDRTWEWDGIAWQEVIPATRPPARTHHAMTYDSQRGKVVMFGGEGTGGALVPSDVWEFDGTTWTPVTASGPAATARVAMVYDAARGKVELFVGDGGGINPSVAVWEWDGAQWTTIGQDGLATPEPRSSPALAYDVTRERVVLFGGQRLPSAGSTALGDTWEWDGTKWDDRAAAAISPGALQDAGMVYDSSEGALIVFGGEIIGDAAERAGTGLRGQTWQRDEFAWRPSAFTSPDLPSPPSPRAGFAMTMGSRDTLMFGGIGPGGQLLNETWDLFIFWDPRTSTPPARAFSAMAYDASRSKFVLFGGAGSNGALSDTWEWNEFDLTGWIASSPVHRPPARQGHVMVYDAAQQQTVLFGGAAGSPLGDTWAWDGNDWTQLSPSNSPSPRTNAAMAYDSTRNRLVLFGGFDGAQILSDTWEWDGMTWQQRTPAHQIPPARRSHVMTFDGSHIVMVGGVHDASATPARLLDDLWEWDGTDWQNMQSTIKAPLPRASHAMAYDADEFTLATFVFGGMDRVGGRLLSDTWQWDGAQWTQDGTFSSARAGHALAFDPYTDSLVLFGGQDSLTSTDLLDDTWEWEDVWDDDHPFLRPAPRFGHAMAFDGSTNTTMLFGGTGFTGLLGDQWAWNGDTWTAFTPATAPPKRTDFALTYDASRNRVVMFGGQGDSSLLSDVWEWSTPTWSNHSSESVFVPSPRSGHALVYDDQRKRVVLFGGRGDTAALNDMWEWNGTTWTQLQLCSPPPPARHHHAMIYDSARDTIVLFGGEDDAGNPLQDTWLFRYADSTAPASICVPNIDDDFDCGPHQACGDFHCDPQESCSTCPGDCGVCP